MDLQKKELDQVLQFIKENDGIALRLEIGNMKLTLRKGEGIRIFKEVAVEGEPAAEEKKVVLVKSPSAGIFYRRPEPDAPPYVDVGSYVEAGDTLALIEVMKTFGPVKTEVDGRVIDIRVEDGEMVEYGQVLILIERGGSNG